MSIQITGKLTLQSEAVFFSTPIMEGPFIVLGEKLCFYKLDVAINTLVDTIGELTHRKCTYLYAVFLQNFIRLIIVLLLKVQYFWIGVILNTYIVLYKFSVFRRSFE